MITSSHGKNVGEMLDDAHREEKKLNGRMLMNILQNIQFFGRQGLALRGHEQNESNFIQLLKLRSHDQPVNPCAKFIIIIIKIVGILLFRILLNGWKEKVTNIPVQIFRTKCYGSCPIPFFVG